MRGFTLKSSVRLTLSNPTIEDRGRDCGLGSICLSVCHKQFLSLCWPVPTTNWELSFIRMSEAAGSNLMNDSIFMISSIYKMKLIVPPTGHQQVDMHLLSGMSLSLLTCWITLIKCFKYCFSGGEKTKMTVMAAVSVISSIFNCQNN